MREKLEPEIAWLLHMTEYLSLHYVHSNKGTVI